MRLGEEGVECVVSAEGRWAYELTLRPTAGVARRARELLADYWQLRGYRAPGP